MSKSTRRALRVTLTVAGMAVLCASFVGTAAAVPSVDDASDAQNTIENNAPEAPSLSNLEKGPVLNNDVINAELPNVKGAAYDMSSFRVVPADGPDDDEDRDGICDAIKDKLPGFPDGVEVQNPCQSDGNNIHDGEFQVGPASAEIPGIEHDGNLVSPNGDSVSPLAGNPGAVTENLELPKQPNQIEDQNLTVKPV